MRRRISYIVSGLDRASSKEYRATMFIGDMYISRLMVYMQQVEEVNHRDREDKTRGIEKVYMNKKSKIGNRSGQQKSGSSTTSSKIEGACIIIY